MFETRRPATPEETRRLITSFNVSGMEDQLATAHVSEIATLADLGATYTVLGASHPRPGAPTVRTVAELEESWSAGGGHPDLDQPRFQMFRAIAAADPTFSPELLFEPTTTTPSGWWLIDAVHRTIGLYSARRAAGVVELRLPVFVLAEPLR